MAAYIDRTLSPGQRRVFLSLREKMKRELEFQPPELKQAYIRAQIDSVSDILIALALEACFVPGE